MRVDHLVALLSYGLRIVGIFRAEIAYFLMNRGSYIEILIPVVLVAGPLSCKYFCSLSKQTESWWCVMVYIYHAITSAMLQFLKWKWSLTFSSFKQCHPPNVTRDYSLVGHVIRLLPYMHPGSQLLLPWILAIELKVDT